MIKIAPSILSANFAEMGNAVKEITACGADYIHVDVMDGVFVPNLTFGFKMIEDIKPLTNIPLDVHLMITEPERYIEKFYKAGADIITIHYEAVKTDVISVLKQIRSYGIKSAISIKPDTPVEEIIPYLDIIDMVLVMLVEPGWGGQQMIEECLEKVTIIREANTDIDIEVDGGINLENAKKVKDAGANIIVAGTAVFKASNKQDTIIKLKSL
jgi:ribulose-phosphate 3-epimerase